MWSMWCSRMRSATVAAALGLRQKTQDTEAFQGLKSKFTNTNQISHPVSQKVARKGASKVQPNILHGGKHLCKKQKRDDKTFFSATAFDLNPLTVLIHSTTQTFSDRGKKILGKQISTLARLYICTRPNG